MDFVEADVIGRRLVEEEAMVQKIQGFQTGTVQHQAAMHDCLGEMKNMIERLSHQVATLSNNPAQTASATTPPAAPIAPPSAVPLPPFHPDAGGFWWNDDRRWDERRDYYVRTRLTVR